jgi:hypothetical protein
VRQYQKEKEKGFANEKNSPKNGWNARNAGQAGQGAACKKCQSKAGQASPQTCA